MNPKARVYYELSRLNLFEDWWHFAILAAIVVQLFVMFIGCIVATGLNCRAH